MSTPSKWWVFRHDGVWLVCPPWSVSATTFRSWRAAYSYAHWASRRD